MLFSKFKSFTNKNIFQQIGQEEHFFHPAEDNEVALVRQPNAQEAGQAPALPHPKPGQLEQDFHGGKNT